MYKYLGLVPKAEAHQRGGPRQHAVHLHLALELEAVLEELSALLSKQELLAMYQEATREPYSFWFIYYLRDKANMFYKRWEERFVVDGDAEPAEPQQPVNGRLPIGGGQQAAAGRADHRERVQQHQVLQQQPAAQRLRPAPGHAADQRDAAHAVQRQDGGLQGSHRRRLFFRGSGHAEQRAAAHRGLYRRQAGGLDLVKLRLGHLRGGPERHRGRDGDRRVLSDAELLNVFPNDPGYPPGAYATRPQSINHLLGGSQRQRGLQDQPPGSDRGPLTAEPSFETSNLPDRYRGKPGAMENVTQAVNDELMHSLDYKLATSNVNYVQSRRDVQYFPSSLSTFTPTTSRVARIPLTSGMDFIDPGAQLLHQEDPAFLLCFANAARGVSCHARHCAHASLHAANRDGCTMYTQSLRCEHLLEGETNSRSPGASACRELSINRVKQARTTLHTKKRQTHIPLHALQRLGLCSIEHEA